MLDTLRIPPSNRLEALTGTCEGQHSIRINKQWRICLRWQGSDVFDVKIVLGRRAITADTALRLGRYFNMEAQFWLNLQSHYDMEVAQELLQDRLDREVHPLPLAA